MKKYDRRLKRGFTLVEVVVALTVISIITGAALSLVLFSSKAETKNFRSLCVVNDAENAVECFRFATDADTMYQALRMADSAYTQAPEGHFVLEGEGYTATVMADFNTNTLDFSASDRDGNIIYQISFTKG